MRPHGLYRPWNSPGQNTGVGSLSHQGIFPTQGSNLGLPHCRQILYHLSHPGSPRILEWGACPFKGRRSRMCKDTCQINKKRKTTHFNKGRCLEQAIYKRGYPNPNRVPWANKHLRKCSESLTFGDMAIKITAWDFPGGPVAKTPHSHCRGHRFGSWLGS